MATAMATPELYEPHCEVLSKMNRHTMRTSHVYGKMNNDIFTIAVDRKKDTHTTVFDYPIKMQAKSHCNVSYQSGIYYGKEYYNCIYSYYNRYFNFEDFCTELEKESVEISKSQIKTSIRGQYIIKNYFVPSNENKDECVRISISRHMRTKPYPPLMDANPDYIKNYYLHEDYVVIKTGKKHHKRAIMKKFIDEGVDDYLHGDDCGKLAPRGCFRFHTTREKWN
jgi:hypothetical protein